MLPAPAAQLQQQHFHFTFVTASVAARSASVSSTPLIWRELKLALLLIFSCAFLLFKDPITPTIFNRFVMTGYACCRGPVTPDWPA